MGPLVVVDRPPVFDHRLRLEHGVERFDGEHLVADAAPERTPANSAFVRNPVVSVSLAPLDGKEGVSGSSPEEGLICRGFLRCR